MFKPDPDAFDSGDPTSYGQDPSFIPNFSFLSLSPPVQRQQQQPRAYGGPPMSTRQNKKQRKSRNNAMNRERTVTTLTEDPNTPYLVPTPSEEPGGSHMAAPFPGAMPGGGKMHNNMAMGPPHSFPMQNNFSGFNYTGGAFGPMQHVHPQQQQPQQQQQQQQQQFFSSPPQKHNKVPQRIPIPDVRPKVPLPPGKNDLEILQNLKKLIIEGQHPFYKAVPAPMSLARLYKGTIPTQSQAVDKRDEQGSTEPNESAEASSSVTSPSISGFTSSVGDYGDRRQRGRPQGGRRPGPGGHGGNQQHNATLQGNQGNRYNNAPGGSATGALNLQNLKPGKNNSGPPSAGVPETQSFDVAFDPPQSDQNGQRRNNEYPGRYPTSESATSGRPSDSIRDNMDIDASVTDKRPVYSGNDEASRPSNWSSRDTAHAPDERDFDSERTVTPRPPVMTGPVSARPTGGPDGYDRMQDERGARRGEWTDRDHTYPDRGRDARLADTRGSSSVAEQRPYDAEYSQPPGRRGTAEPPLPPDSRPLTDIAPAGDVRPAVEARPPPDSHADVRAIPVRTNDRAGLDTEDIQSSRSSSVRPTDSSAPLGSIPPAGDGNADDSSARPSLKDRLTTRPSRAPVEPAIGAEEQHPPHYVQDRSRKPNRYRGNGGPPYDEPRRMENFARPTTPRDDDGPHYPTSGGPPRRAFVPREGRKNLSPASRGGHRGDYIDPRGPLPRDDGPGYRPDFRDPRYPGGVDPDAPRYDGRPYRDFSPPLSAGRGPPSDAPPGRDYHQYPPAARRDWGGLQEEEYYKSRGWDGPPHDRGRHDREYPPPRGGGWEGRPDRDYPARDYPPGPPGPPPDDRYPPGPGLARDADRTRPPPPGGYGAPFSRVRPRSPSPLRRPGPGPIDDARPPIKRPREDFVPDYYGGGGGGGREPMRRPPGDYPHPPRSSSQGPPNSAWPPPPSTGLSAGGGPPSDRDYRMGRDSLDYAPPPGGAYDRRSPGPPGGRMPYNRGGGGYGRGGGEPRDRGGYGMPRP